MTIQDLGALGEFLGSIAVLATLVYLALQIRQSSINARAANTSSYTAMWLTFRLAIAQDEKLNSLFWRGLDDPESLSEEEVGRFDSLLSGVVQLIEQGYAFHSDGVAHPGQWEAIHARLLWLAGRPGFQNYWSRWQDVRNPVLQAEVDRIIASGESSMTG